VFGKIRNGFTKGTDVSPISMNEQQWFSLAIYFTVHFNTSYSIVFTGMWVTAVMNTALLSGGKTSKK
jgi:hypothetical protein